MSAVTVDRSSRRKDTRTNTHPVLIEVGRRLRAHREHLGLSLTAAGARTGFNAIRLGSYERADRELTLSGFFAVAEAYGLDPVSLLPATGGQPFVADDQLVHALRGLADRLEAKDGDQWT